MERQYLAWQLGVKQTMDAPVEVWMKASVPGCAQKDYAAFYGWESAYTAPNTDRYKALEDVYWLYRAPLRFDLKENQRATMVFGAIDYRYRISVNGEMLHDGEGMFSQIRCDVTKFAGTDAWLEVLVWPSPKSDDSNTRDQANHSCKAAACYGWDWHPRLLTCGIWDDTYLEIAPKTAVETMDISYRLSDDLKTCSVHVQAHTGADTHLSLAVTLDDKTVVAIHGDTVNKTSIFDFTIEDAKLWYPVGYGEQPVYCITVSDGQESKTRKVGFRRSRLVMNEGSWAVVGYPKSRANAPATLEVNGIRVFAKGSNWVNAMLFPGDMNEDHYRSLIQKAVDCNMNIFRVWGGGYVNKESFFDICDELGVMVWQEFPLACNEYPDEDRYLSVLKSEATNIVRRLRTHPSVVMWCGGNELFNSWSGMTEQHHALRLLDSICFAEDRFTPFDMTSPLNGMAHGPYRNYDEGIKEELITSVRKHHDTAYTEFGAPGMSNREVILSFMSEEEFNKCEEGQPAWEGHFGFHAGWYESWVRKVEVNHYFGGFTDTDDLIRKTQFIQAMSYRSVFEEARFQWPHCSMVVNWCWNEPYACAANNSVLCWPDVPKPCHRSIALALRPQEAAFRVDRHLWNAGESFTGEIWILNDSADVLTNGNVTLEYNIGDGWAEWGMLRFGDVDPRRNQKCGVFTAEIPVDYDGLLKIRLKVDGRPDMDSEYSYICRCKKTVKKKMLNADW